MNKSHFVSYLTFHHIVLVVLSNQFQDKLACVSCVNEIDELVQVVERLVCDDRENHYVAVVCGQDIECFNDSVERAVPIVRNPMLIMLFLEAIEAHKDCEIVLTQEGRLVSVDACCIRVQR